MLRPQGQKKSEVRGIIYDRVLTPLVFYIYILDIFIIIFIYPISHVSSYSIEVASDLSAHARVPVSLSRLLSLSRVVPCPGPACHEVRSGELRDQGLPGQVLQGAPCVCLLCMFCSDVCPRPHARTHKHTYVVATCLQMPRLVKSWNLTQHIPKCLEMHWCKSVAAKLFQQPLQKLN